MKDQKPKCYWPDNTIYFLTGSTFLHFPYFRDDKQKQVLLGQINKIKERFDIANLIYSLAINHYHVKFFLKNGLDLAKIKQILHGGTAYLYKKNFSMRYKEMWQSSRTLQVLSEEMDSRVTGYIIGNLLKHKEVSTFQELKENPFSSYAEIAKKHGDEFARQLVYSVIDVGEGANGEVDYQGLQKLKLEKTSS